VVYPTARHAGYAVVLPPGGRQSDPMLDRLLVRAQFWNTDQWGQTVTWTAYVPQYVCTRWR